MDLFVAAFVVAFCGYLMMRVGMLFVEAQQEAAYRR